MPSLNRGWQSGWFYLRNDGGLLPGYTGKMVTECPQKWVWGAPAEEQKRLAPLLAGLEKLHDARVTAATVATAFHKRSLLPLVQRRAFMFEMTQDVPWVGTRMLAEPVSASDIAARVAKTTHQDLKNSRVVPMRPEKGYICLVRRYFCFFIFALVSFFFLPQSLFLFVLQGMGIVKDSLPPVPEDKATRAKNRARNEEQKKAKEDKKAKAARKAQRQEISAKNHCEAEKAGVPPPDSPETSVSEIEGGGDNAHWLDKLAEEDGVIPPVSGGIEIPEGSKTRGGSEAPEGSQVPGGGQTVPHIVVDDEDGAPREGSVPVGPREREKASGGGSEVPPQPVAPEGPTEPRLASGAEAGGPVEASRAETAVEVPAPSAGETGVQPTAPGASGGPQGAPSS